MSRTKDDVKRTIKVLGMVSMERKRQQDFFDAGRIPFQVCNPDVAYGHKLAVATEELGEVAKAILEQHCGDDDAQQQIKTELIQLAAVCVAWVESFE